ncbi:hypothetical protein F2Q69_00035196 [Brassica cretica]|uniref:Uncharacterized protein n=1 Tax=Brassica cretica TaxID=69181 RepID=A0A8S9SCD7_BRACR|nr:hypothetical protein F2Q69_00035196 [Brassica cretica]
MFCCAQLWLTTESCWGNIFHEEITPASGLLLQLPGSCSSFRVLAPASRVLPPALVLGSLLEKYSGIEFLQIPGRTPASGSLLGDAPGPRWKVLRVRSQGPPSSSKKWKYSDKGILPYFRIWKSLTLLADQDRPTDDLHYKYRSLNLKKGVQEVHDQSSIIRQPPGQDSTHRRPSWTRLGEADPGDYHQRDEDICSLQHVHNSTYWLRPRSPAHQQDPSMLTEAHRRSMLTAAYRQVYHLFQPCAL